MAAKKKRERTRGRERERMVAMATVKGKTYDSAEVAERGLAAPAFRRPTFRSILPMAVFKMAAACSCKQHE